MWEFPTAGPIVIVLFLTSADALAQRYLTERRLRTRSVVDPSSPTKSEHATTTEACESGSERATDSASPASSDSTPQSACVASARASPADSLQDQLTTATDITKVSIAVAQPPAAAAGEASRRTRKARRSKAVCTDGDESTSAYAPTEAEYSPTHGGSKAKSSMAAGEFSLIVEPARVRVTPSPPPPAAAPRTSSSRDHGPNKQYGHTGSHWV